MTRDDLSVHQGQKMLVENSNTYTVSAISRQASGEYKCSLADNEKMEASQNVVVSCKYTLTSGRLYHVTA